MSVASILQAKGRDVLTIGPDATLQEAASLLSSRKVGALVVTDAESRILGILSERDIVRLVGSDGADALSRKVSTVMTKDVKLCTETDSVNRVMHKMTAGRFRHLPVEDNGKLAGIISIGDVVKRRIEEVEREAEDIRSYIATV